MESSLDLTTRLSTESEYKSLYGWSLQEFDADGRKVGGDQVPWAWSLFFRSTEISRSHSARWSSFSEAQKVEERDILRCRLEPVQGEFRAAVAYSMFGTRRRISDFSLQVYRLPEGESKERCVVGGIVEWEFQEESSSFRETVPDALFIEVYLLGERFSRMLKVVGDGKETELGLRIDGVSGLYSNWSPSIKTSSIKVLTGNGQHEVERPAGCEFTPPVLGSVSEFDLTGQRVLRAAAPATEEDVGGDESVPSPPSSQQIAQAVVLAVVGRLDQLKYMLGGILALLILLLIFKH